MVYIKHETINNSKQLLFKVFNFHAHNLNRVIPMHWHQSTELLYCEHGQLEVKLKNYTFMLNKNDFIVINPYQIHSTKSPQKNSVLCIQLPLYFLNALTSNQFLHSYIFVANSCKQKNIADQKLCSAFKSIIKLQSQPHNLVRDLKITTLVLNIIRLLTQFYSRESNIFEEKSNIKFVEELTSYITQNYNQNLKISDVATYFSYSKGYTSRLIKKNLGTSFTALLQLVRINKAIDIMNSSSKTWIEIAELTGFKNYRNLYNAFIEIYQKSPNQFKTDQKIKSNID